MGHEGQFDALRSQMVEEQLVRRGIEDAAVLDAMRSVLRHEFVLEDLKHRAYEDGALPLGPGQSISQPFIVAFMLQALELEPEHRVLEIGTGSGYQAALLAEIVSEVFTLDIDEGLVSRAEAILTTLEYKNITAQVGNGFEGLPETGPFDRIIVAAAPQNVPRDLIGQLTDDGKMILPLGTHDQELILFTKSKDGLTSKELGGVRFVEMVP